jgi:S-DNA-T family DNA segregation ATPase FtsK/SpoIIIE
LKVVGSAILLWALILVLACLFVDATPRNIWLWIRYKNTVRKERVERDRARYAEEQEQKRLELRQRLAEEEILDEPRKKLSLRKNDNLETEIAPDIPEDLENATIVGEAKREFFEEVAASPRNMPEPEAKPVAEPAAKSEPKEEINKTETQKVFADPTEFQLQADDGDDSAPFIDVESENMFNIPEEPEEEETVIPWVQPPLDLLNADPGARADQSESIAETKTKLLRTLESFGVRVKGIGYSVGPTITRYEVVPEAGVRVKQIANLVDDIAMSLATVGVRIEAPIPNKPAVGVEVPNEVRANVYLKTLIDDDQFWNSSPLTVCLGQDVAGKNVYFDIKKMPHMIIAGTTGAGKSVCINCLVCSLLYKNPADKVKLIMIDPKKVEFNMYQHIPHLYCPIISDPRKAAGALASAVTEMERRYTLVEDVGVRDIDSYNKITANDPDREYLPKLIIIIDELADLMMTAKQDVELFITRIAQKARAVGIHLIIGTQRPSVDVITGLIKANVPSRIACTVKSQVDSRTIIDISGAEKLIGRGDMLFSPVGMAKPMRVQGAFLEDDEVRRVVDFIKDNNEPVVYNNSFMDNMEAAAASMEADGKKGGADFTPADGGGDDKFRQALEVAVNEGKISTSLLQRKLSIGYGKAAKIIDEMEEAGFVSAPDGNKPRRVLMTKQEFYEKALNDELPTSND